MDGAKHLTGRHRTVTAHLVAHLAEIYARKLHVAERYSYLGDYCVAELGLSEDEGHRRAHAATLAQKYPMILDMLLEGSIHLTSLRVIGRCLTPENHRKVLESARGKTMTELEHLAAAVSPKPDVPTMLRKLPDPRPESGCLTQPETAISPSVEGAVVLEHQPSAKAQEGDVLVMTPRPAKARMNPIAPGRYSLHMTIDQETHDALLKLQDLERHKVPNGDLAKIIKASVLGRLELVERQKCGKTKRAQKAREQESWIEEGKAATEARASVKEQVGQQPSGAIASGRLKVNSRHIPALVKRKVWKRDNGRCAFVGRGGRRCSVKGRLEYHHIQAYALGGPATVENIALRCRTHNAYEGVRFFGEKRAMHAASNAKKVRYLALLGFPKFRRESPWAIAG